MTIDIPTSAELNHVDELPEPLAEAVRKGLSGTRAVKLLIFKPLEKAGTEVSPPKALAVTEREFVFAEMPEGRPIRTIRSRFDGVLLVEMATLLLYGHLKIDFVRDGVRSDIAMEYNMAAHDLYRRAATLILEGAARPGAARTEAPAAPTATFDLEAWPEPFRGAAEFALLPGLPAQAGALWGSVRGGFAHELVPAGAVLARANRLTVLTLEQAGSWNRVRAEMTGGIIATYLPAGHISSLQVHATPKLAVIDLEMHAQHGGERFQLAIPSDRLESVRKIVEQVLKS